MYNLVCLQITKSDIKLLVKWVTSDGHFNLPYGVCVGMYWVNKLTLSPPRFLFMWVNKMCMENRLAPTVVLHNYNYTSIHKKCVYSIIPQWARDTLTVAVLMPSVQMPQPPSVLSVLRLCRAPKHRTYHTTVTCPRYLLDGRSTHFQHWNTRYTHHNALVQCCISLLATSVGLSIILTPPINEHKIDSSLYRP